MNTLKVNLPAVHPSLMLGSIEIRQDEKGLVSLTDIYRAAESKGLTSGKRNPSDWSREAGAPFIEFVAEQLHTRKAGIYKTSRARADRGGGTYAHWQIALAYAKYLSPELHMQVNEVYARAKSGDVTLADEIAERASPQQQQWLLKRMQGKVARSELTSTLAKHGVVGRGYADCTNAIYRNVLGGSKKDICAVRGIEYQKNRSLRDQMNVEDLISTSMAEMVAAKQIRKFNVQGNAPCEMECDRSARRVAALLQ